jgi:hypothetical protein
MAVILNNENIKLIGILLDYDFLWHAKHLKNKGT